MRGKWYSGAASVLALTVVSGGAAHAQENRQGAAATDELIVTAQRRAERLQDAPLAVTALSAAALEARNVSTLEDAARFAPNIRFDSTAAVSGARYSSTVFIRGVGQIDYAGFSEPGVGTYVDGVYYARSIGGVLDTLDLAQIEILRGPQGTLFGRNTIGGAVLVTTQRPTNEWEGRVQATAGSFNRQDLQASVNIPLVDDTLMARLSLASINRDGTQERILVGDTTGNRNTDISRLQVRWLPTDALTLDFSADYTHVREQSAPMSVIAVGPAPGLTGVPLLTTFNATFAATAPIVAPNGQQSLNNSFVTNDPDWTYATGPNVNNLDAWGVSATASWNISPSLELRNILAYREQDALAGRDGDNTPYTYRESTIWFEQQQFSEELQLIGDFGRLTWVAGLYYFQERGEDYGEIDLAVGGAIPASSRFRPVYQTASYAAYGQATYNVTPTFGVTLGGRISHDEKESVIYQNFPGSRQFVGTPDGEWTSFTPIARLQYQPSRDFLFYLSYAEGFKAGGFNSRPSNPQDLTIYGPEQVVSYEVGAKTAWFDQRLIANFAVFHSDYTDIQQSVIGPQLSFIANAGAAEIRGVEAEFAVAPNDYIDLNLAVGYTDAYFTDVGVGLSPGQTLPITLNSRFVKVPEWTVSGGVQIEQPLGAIGRLFWRADATYYSDYYNDIANSPELRQPAYTLVNARVTFEPETQPWRISLFGTNLTDERYLVSGSKSNAVGIVEGTYSEQRMWGVSINVDF